MQRRQLRMRKVLLLLLLLLHRYFLRINHRPRSVDSFWKLLNKIQSNYKQLVYESLEKAKAIVFHGPKLLSK